MAKRGTPAVVSTGIEGLDAILRGGLPASNLYILHGAPGSGKTTAALQFLRAGVEAGESCIYVTLSQTSAELRAIANSHGWSLDGIRIEELTTSGTVSEADDQSIFLTSDLRLDETRKAIEAAIDEHKPRRLVYDSLLEIRLITGDSPRFRRELIGFKSFLAKRNVVALLLDTQVAGYDRSGEEVEGLAHGVIRLDKALEEYGGVRRRIEISKMRGFRSRTAITTWPSGKARVLSYFLGLCRTRHRSLPSRN